MVESTPNRKLPACVRCSTRKTKCDSQVPSCHNCVRAGTECMVKDKILNRTVPRDYFCSLEDRIRAYEGDKLSFEHPNTEQQSNRFVRKLDESNKRMANYQGQVPLLSRSSSPPQPQQASKSETPDSGPSLPSSDDEYGSIQDTMGTILASTVSGGAATFVSDDLDHQIRKYSNHNSSQSPRERFVDGENMAIAKLGRDFLKHGRRNNTKNKVTDITAYDYKILTRLAKRYFRWMNSAHPVLHECMFHFQLKNCRNKSETVSPIDHFQVKMVIAISLASISRPHVSTSEIGRIAHEFWKSASRLRGRVLTGGGIKKLQNILLLLQYALLIPKAGNLWQLSGLAMKFATEMGLYAEPSPSHNFSPLTLDLRRRIFWTCYCIDRILATVMGRPIGIPDTWISTKFPALVEDRLVTVQGIGSGPICHLKVAQLQQIRIFRLQSEIHQRLYAPSYPDKDHQIDMVQWSWQMYDQLRLWRSMFRLPTPLITKEWTELQFHIAIVLLFRPSPNRPKLSDEALHVTFHSAGEVMRLVKIMHREYSAVFSWLTVQNLFMCGLTFVNSLKELVERRESHQLCTSFVEIILQIQSCTSMLETLSALEAGTNEKIRNAFEMISSNILQHITSIAQSLPQQSEGGCIWSKIAKLDNISLLRPIQIEGAEIPIQEYSSILEQTNMQDWENGHRENEHFYEHDIDASAKDGMFDAPPNEDLYVVSKGVGSQRNADTVKQTGNLANAKDNLESNYKMSSSNRTVHPLSSHEDSNMERPVTISKTVADAEPIRELSLFPDWSEVNLSAELDRWFLYPLSDTSEQFSI